MASLSAEELGLRRRRGGGSIGQLALNQALELHKIGSDVPLRLGLLAST